MSNNTGASEQSVSSPSNATPSSGEGDTNQAQQPEQPQQTGWQMAKGVIIRMLIMYIVMSYFRRPAQPPTTTDTATGETTAAMPKIPSLNMFGESSQLDFYFYLSENSAIPDRNNRNELIGKMDKFTYGDWTAGPTGDSTHLFSKTFKTSQELMNNGSIYLHIYLLPHGMSPFQEVNKEQIIHKTHQMNKYKRRKFISTVNLLTGKTDTHPDLIKKENSSESEILSHWHPNITINYVVDQTPWTEGAVPQPLDEHIQFVKDKNQYYPAVYVNDYWNLQSDYMPINDTTPELNLTLTVYPLSLLKWQFYAAQGMRNKCSVELIKVIVAYNVTVASIQLIQSGTVFISRLPPFTEKYSNLLGEGSTEQTDTEQDALKQTLLDTNPYLLALTICVSLVHSVFEFLAFKNDIQFWRNRKSLEGLSVRSVFFQVFQSLIVLLYILDNETNFIVIISVGVGLLIDAWKITQVINLKLDYENRWFDTIPRLTYTDKSTYIQSKTKDYDQMAFKYLSWALFPLLFGYGIYSLMYHEHKGWYSWVLGMLYGFLLMFGFIMMTPQLFINYKLKSVAHLPWRMMTYKALNTFIDDLFAFVIKMPTLYRIGCFRDDIVFLIFLYQRWVYKVDPTRVNEFGTSGEMPEDQPLTEDGATGAALEHGDTAIKSSEEKKKD